MAKPFKQNANAKTWTVRVRVRGQDVCLSGFKTKAEAAKAAAAETTSIQDRGAARGFGPYRTTVAQALQDYGMERLRFMKGARQEANRFNRYLGAAGLATLVVTTNAEVTHVTGNTNTSEGSETSAVSKSTSTGAERALASVSLAPATQERRVANGLGCHRVAQAARTAKSDRLRQQLAGTLVADVTRHQVQDFVDALRIDGLSASTVALERAVLRRIFNHCRTSWNWAVPVDNPATQLKMCAIDNGRSRVEYEHQS